MRLSLQGTGSKPIRNGSKTGPTFLQVQFWIRSGPVRERSRVNRSQSDPVRFGTVPVDPVPCKRSIENEAKHHVHRCRTDKLQESLAGVIPP